MTEIEISCDPNVRPTGPSWMYPTKFTSAILFLVLSLLIKLLLDHGENIIVSWGNVLFLILYTIFLFLVFILVIHSYTDPFRSDESSYLSRLVRVKSRLTFLPITHFIRQQNIIEKPKTNENTTDYQSGPATKTELSCRIDSQRDLLIDAILEGYVFPWYNKISNEETFPSHFKNILQSVCTRFHDKIKRVDRTTLAKEAIQLIHYHWKEYCDSINKANNTEENLLKNFKLSHSFVESKSELSKHYESLVCAVLRELVIPDLQSTLLCQFLSGILVKCFVLYYVDLLSQPKWINTSLVCLISSGGLEMSHSSQNCPLPETPVSTCSSSFFTNEESTVKITSSASATEYTPIQWDEKSQSENGHSSPLPSMDFCSDDLQLSRNVTPSDDASLNEIHHPCLQPLECSFHENKRMFEGADVDTKDETTSDSTKREIYDVLKNSLENEESEPFIEDTRKTSTHILMKKKDTNILNESLVNDTKGSQPAHEKRHPKEKLKLAKSNPTFGSVSSALSGLLNTAALPLLPEGCHGSLEDLPGRKTTVNFTSQLTPPPTTVSTELSVSDDVKRRLSADNQRNPNACSEIFSDWKEVSAKVNSRHYSFGEITKTKMNYNLETKSLDESKSQLILRQEEFDFSSDGNVGKLRATEEDNKSNISPMYEEPEDFAATIAKLRSLLEQRESQKNLMANDKDTTDGAQELPTKSSPEPNAQVSKHTVLKGRPSLNSQSSASSLGSDGSGGSLIQLSSLSDIDKLEKIVDELEDPEPINRLFMNVTVAKAESLNDSSDQHTLYSIQYEGVYPEEDDDGQLGKIVLRTTTVKRRFKEFLLLQSHLEENKIFKPHLKGIKAPTKWLNLSFTKADTVVLNQRKTLLEKYLQQLCYHPILGFCPELRQFMAYGEEGFQAFCLSDGGGHPYRFDKLAKKFTGVINTLRDALPTFESDNLSVPSSPDGVWKSPGDSKGSRLFSSFLQFGEKMSPEEIKTVITASTPESTQVVAAFEPDWEIGPEEAIPTEVGICANKPERSISTESLSEEPLQEENGSTYPLAAAVTQLLCDVLWLPDHRPHTASVGAFMSISGKSLENYVQETLDMFLSEEAFLGYLEWLTTAMHSWNDAAAAMEEQTGYYTESDLKNCLKKKIPVWVRWMWGRRRLDMTIERMAGFCQNSVLNHDLILSLIELSFSKIVETKDNHMDNPNPKDNQS